MRHEVTGHKENRKSIFLSYGAPPRIEIRPNENEITEVWSTKVLP